MRITPRGRARLSVLIYLLLAPLMVACDDDDSSDALTPDALAPDAQTPDMALPDMALPDALTPDMALPDAMMPDMALPDMALPDALTPDAMMPDAALPDPDAAVLPAPPLPTELPLTFARLDETIAPTLEETQAVTSRLAVFLTAHDYFQWLLDTSHGMEIPEGELPDEVARAYPWKVFWTGVEAVKQAGEVTFLHTEWGGPDNIMIPTPRALTAALGGFALLGEPAMGQVVADYSRGIASTVLGMVWDDQDQGRAIMARAVIPNDHTVTLSDGRQKHIDAHFWRHETVAWNTRTIQVAQNPFFGDIWVKNMRSKDDVPHLFWAAAFLPFLLDDPNLPAEVREPAALALTLLSNFAKDIVDSGYVIRTKNARGEIYVPDKDLASFVWFEQLVPNAECNAKVSAAYIGYNQHLDNRCGTGDGGIYEDMAMAGHYYNLWIIRGFHLSAVAHALRVGDLEAAGPLLEGLALKADEDFDRPEERLPTEPARWRADLATFLLQAATVGLPLTGREAALIQSELGMAIETMDAFPYWDLWSESVGDGRYPTRPGANLAVEDMGLALLYCYSPLKNPAGVPPVDCPLLLELMAAPR